jgi:hypothetical protein
MVERDDSDVEDGAAGPVGCPPRGSGEISSPRARTGVYVWRPGYKIPLGGPLRSMTSFDEQLRDAQAQAENERNVQLSSYAAGRRIVVTAVGAISRTHPMEGMAHLPSWYPWLLLLWVALFVVGTVVLVVLALLWA